MIKAFTGQPKPFYMIFMLEIWERFGYYALNTILTFSILHKGLGFEESQSALYYGAFFAIIFGLTFVGGLVGDKILGAKRTAVLGLVILLFGYTILAISPNIKDLLGFEKSGFQFIVFFALALVCTGSAFFKANPSNLLAMCYKTGDTKLHEGFTMYYMAINIGSLVADFFAPIVAQKFGWNIAMYFSSIGIIVALSNFYFFRNVLKDIGTAAGKLILTYKKILLTIVIFICLIIISMMALYFPYLALIFQIILAIGAISYYISYMVKLDDKKVKLKMFVALVLIIEAIMFFVLYSQKGSLINLYAISNVDTSLFGMEINSQSFQAFNPFWIIILAPFLVSFYDYLDQKNIKISFGTKFCTGLTVSGVAYFILYISHFFADANSQVSGWWLISSLFCYSLAELLLSALGMAMISDLVPKNIRGFVMGMWFLASSFGGLIGSYMASYIVPDKSYLETFTALERPIVSLAEYSDGFFEMMIFTMIVTILTWILLPFLNKIINLK